jgi:hypothetical protein
VSISDTFGLLAGVLALFTYGLYAVQMHHGTSIPNPATWLIWLILGVINTRTYFVIVHGRWYQSLVAIAVTCCVALLFADALIFGRFSPISGIDRYCLAGCAILMAVWAYTGSARIANFLAQVIYLISYFPTIVGLRNGTSREAPVPWLLAATTYGSASVSIAADYSGDWLTLAYPVVTGVGGNLTIALLAFHHQTIAPTNTR